MVLSGAFFYHDACFICSHRYVFQSWRLSICLKRLSYFYHDTWFHESGKSWFYHDRYLTGSRVCTLANSKDLFAAPKWIPVWIPLKPRVSKPFQFLRRCSYSWLNKWIHIEIWPLSTRGTKTKVHSRNPTMPADADQPYVRMERTRRSLSAKMITCTQGLTRPITISIRRLFN